MGFAAHPILQKLLKVITERTKITIFFNWKENGTGQNPPLDSFLTFTVSASVAQGWVDNGLAGLALSTIDDGDDRSRFNFIQGDAGDNPAADTAGRLGATFDKKQSFFR